MKASTDEEKKALRSIIKKRGDGGKWKECPCGWFFKAATCPDKKCKIAYPGGKTIIKMYAHSGKEAGYDAGEKLGLDDAALRNFSYWGSEIEFEVEVDLKTGNTKIISCDGKKLLY